MLYATSTDFKIRVLLADMHHVVRQGIRYEIENRADMIVVGETADGYEVLDLAVKLRPDVIILDVKLARLSSVKVIQSLNELSCNLNQPTPHILVFSAYADKYYMYSLLASGVEGYLLKSEPLERLLDAVCQVHAGEIVLSQIIQTNLVKSLPYLHQELSAGEIKVLQLLAHGLSNREIAQNLGVSEGTIRSHLSNIYRKIPWIRSRAEAVAWAWINHIVSEPEME